MSQATKSGIMMKDISNLYEVLNLNFITVNILKEDYMPHQLLKSQSVFRL